MPPSTITEGQVEWQKCNRPEADGVGGQLAVARPGRGKQRPRAAGHGQQRAAPPCRIPSTTNGPADVGDGAPTSCMISISSCRAAAASRTTLATVRAEASASSMTITQPERAEQAGPPRSTGPASGGRSGRPRRRAMPPSVVARLSTVAPASPRLRLQPDLERGRKRIALEPLCRPGQVGKVLAESRGGLRLRHVLAVRRRGRCRATRSSTVLQLIRRGVVFQVDRELGRLRPAADEPLQVRVHDQEEAEHEQAERRSSASRAPPACRPRHRLAAASSKKYLSARI